uniref:Uncharacterized protein n=1 Tax=Corethron hystrix TaxID=216773 RepID=A0A7S1FZR3_9STRA|mmetsp:Transcript_41931/g.98284  ORF Transcript_41931/g.98284 Transcript_41931/m.98284 type:complete len:365 (+) Transcript_41931:217-1311(+)
MATEIMPPFFRLWRASFVPGIVVRVAALMVSVRGDRDTNSLYGAYSNPNVEYGHYWATPANVLEDLSSFQRLYVKFGGCAWSQSSTMESYGSCSQYSGSEDEWWQNMGECRASNVAYSLYGVLPGDNSFWRRSGCSKSTFINSFFTLDGLYNFVAASNAKVSNAYSSSYCSEYSSDDDENSGSGDKRRLSGSGDGEGTYSTLGCSSTGRFVQDIFDSESCYGANYLYTVDTLDNLNESLEDHMQCTMIYKKDKMDYATQLLSYSQTCTITGEYKEFCPDPHGVLMTYEYNLAVAQNYPNYVPNIQRQYGYYQNDWSSPSDARLLKKSGGSLFFAFGSLFFVMGFYIRYKRERPEFKCNVQGVGA